MSYLWFAVATITLVAACGEQALAPTGTQARLAVDVNLAGTAVATVIVQVSAPDIPTPLVFNLVISNSVASGTITLPAGSNRTITLLAYDASGVETQSGSMVVSIQSGTNSPISVTLTPLTGDLPLTANLGAYAVTVTPSSASVALSGGDTVRLSASIKDTQGNPVTGNVSWATLNPGVAIVDSTGLVSGTGAGTTKVSAVFKGVTGTSNITVTP
ncbi:MAG TPA: Ig-like domain-containing protein [Solirubrobacteraceae bacterium]|nr:Ig-like domain-containing protein [Solirubrobacteraceae bacterium]